MQQFDPNRPNQIQGEIASVRVSQPPSPTQGDSNLVVDRRHEFLIHVEWEIYGHDVPLWLAALADTWSVSAFAESLGAGPEMQVGTADVVASAAQACNKYAGEPHCHRWNDEITVPADLLDEGNPGGLPTSPSGIYMLAVTVFLNRTLGTGGFDMSGFNLGPAIQVESPI